MQEQFSRPSTQANSTAGNDARAAFDEMERVLDVGPRMSEAVFRGDARLTRRWRHGPLDNRMMPMHENVIVTFYGPSQPMAWRDGRRHETTATKPGAITLIPSGHEARWRNGGPLEVSHVYLPDAHLQACGDALGAHTGAVQLLDRIAFEDPMAGRLLGILALEAENPGANSKLFFDQAIDLLSLHLLRAHSSINGKALPRGPRGLPNWRVQRATDYLKAHLDQEVRLDDLAKLVGLSRFHFCTAFRLATGQAPHQWFTALRMARARELLADVQLPVLQIALAVGYQTASAFATAFRKHQGLTPTEFRRRL
ncbi:MAG: AraC family transcriptional regulator [Pseudomonadota bacterium]